MTVLVDILSWALILAGSFFIVTGAIGLVRLPDVYTRLHGAGVVDTLGAALFIGGLMLQGGFTLITVKLGLILVFLFFTGPTASYALANALRAQGIKAVADGEVASPSDAPLKTREGPSSKA